MLLGVDIHLVYKKYAIYSCSLSVDVYYCNTHTHTYLLLHIVACDGQGRLGTAHTGLQEVPRLAD